MNAETMFKHVQMARNSYQVRHLSTNDLNAGLSSMSSTVLLHCLLCSLATMQPGQLFVSCSRSISLKAKPVYLVLSVLLQLINAAITVHVR